jgi:hypothetical protein
MRLWTFQLSVCYRCIFLFDFQLKFSMQFQLLTCIFHVPPSTSSLIYPPLALCCEELMSWKSSLPNVLDSPVAPSSYSQNNLLRGPRVSHLCKKQVQLKICWPIFETVPTMIAYFTIISSEAFTLNCIIFTRTAEFSKPIDAFSMVSIIPLRHTYPLFQH